MSGNYQRQFLFEEPKAVPAEGLSRSPFPEELAKTYTPSRRRIVIQYTPEQQEKLMSLLGLAEIREIAYDFEDILHD